MRVLASPVPASVRVPAVYLKSPEVSILAFWPFCIINKLRVFNGAEEFNSRRLHQVPFRHAFGRRRNHNNSMLKLSALWFCLLLSLAAAQAPKVPLATFQGTVHGVSNKQITIETEEANLVDFDINKKTKIMRGKKQITAQELVTGDAVTIEARQEFGEFLVAVTIAAKSKD